MIPLEPRSHDQIRSIEKAFGIHPYEDRFDAVSGEQIRLRYSWDERIKEVEDALGLYNCCGDLDSRANRAYCYLWPKKRHSNVGAEDEGDAVMGISERLSRAERILGIESKIDLPVGGPIEKRLQAIEDVLGIDVDTISIEGWNSEVIEKVSEILEKYCPACLRREVSMRQEDDGTISTNFTMKFRGSN